MKISRVILLAKSIRKEIAQTLHPSVVSLVRVDGKPVDHETIRSTNVFMGGLPDPFLRRRCCWSAWTARAW